MQQLCELAQFIGRSLDLRTRNLPSLHSYIHARWRTMTINGNWQSQEEGEKKVFPRDLFFKPARASLGRSWTSECSARMAPSRWPAPLVYCMCTASATCM